MDAILHDLGGIVLKAVPTLVLVILLHFYLKRVFFRPLEKVLRERYEATEGARRNAELSLEKASAKAAEYEAAMRSARGEVYQAQERIHVELEKQREAELAAARSRAETMIQEAKREIAEEVAREKAGLARESERLADEIVGAVLGRRTA